MLVRALSGNGGSEKTYGLETVTYTGGSNYTITISDGLFVAWDTTQYVHGIYSFENGVMTKLLEYSAAQASGAYNSNTKVFTYREYYNVKLLIYKVE